MQIINRPKYLEQITPFVDKPVIKVLIGMRRVGKSTLLELIQERFLTQVPRENIVHLNFESLDLINIIDAASLTEYLKKFLKNRKGKMYFFFDEVQLVEHWERVINALRVDVDCDIYLTGSNSTLLSGELATLLAGRYVQFEILPFTFREFTDLYRSVNNKVDELFQKYVLLGGMPFLQYFELAEEPSYKYLLDVYHTVLVKDVLEFQKIRDVGVFQRILNFTMENIGQIFSATSIHKFFRNERINVSVDTILNYLNYCQQAFIIRKVPRYQVTGKQLLKVDEKYYLSDHGFRQALGYSNRQAIERVLENIVYNELVSRGFEVSIGKVGTKEIDFIAQKEEQMEYYQVSYLLASEDTRQREFGVYSQVNDNYPKYVLSLDKMNFSQAGIIHKNLIDFLLE